MSRFLLTSHLNITAWSLKSVTNCVLQIGVSQYTGFDTSGLSNNFFVTILARYESSADAKVICHCSMLYNINMEPKDRHLEKLFQEFQSSFNQAAPEKKRRLAAVFYSWAKQEVDSLGIPTLNEIAKGVTEDRQPPPLTTPGSFQSNNRQEAIIQDMQDLVEGEIHLRQIAENIEQVFWLRDIRSDRILYVSPAFETVWGRSSESLYADPLILIESIHPEDRVQVLVARPHNIHKPFDQVYRILRPDGSLRWIFARTFLIRDESGESDCLFCIAQDITDQKQVELALRKTLDRTREQFDLSRKMSLARKPEAVLKILMSAYELRSAQRATLLFFDNPRLGPASGVGVTAAWLSSQNPIPWVSESNLYEEAAFWELLSPGRTVVFTGIQSDPRLTPLVRDFLREGQIQTLVIFPLVAMGDWLGCLLVYFKQEQHFDHIELRHLKVLVDPGHYHPLQPSTARGRGRIPPRG